jgi:hypothetical protein
VALCAQCDQVFFGISTGMAPELPVVHLEISHYSATLASPSISPKNCFAKFLVGLKSQTHGWVFWSNWGHKAIWFACARNLWRCSQGRNLKKLVIDFSKISGSRLSRLAPARKSAQIISRQ